MLIEHEGYRIPDIYKTEPPWVERMRKEFREEDETRGMLRVITNQLEQRFEPLPATAVARLEAMDAEQLTTLSRRLLTADSLDELGLS